MGDKVKNATGKIKEAFGKLNKTVRTLLILIVLVTVALIAGLTIYRMTRPYAVLFTDLASDDMTSILGYLESIDVTDYRVRNNDTILVPASREAALKAQVLQQGYPSSGFAYERYLNGVGMLSSESDRRTMYLFDLQDRLGAVVSCFDGVKDAKVTISQGEDRRYILQDDVVEASASVIVTMKGGHSLTLQQAQAIRSLISKSVQDLKIDNVTISDGSGNTFESDGGGGIGYASTATQLKMELENQVNTSVRNNVLELLIPLFGAKNLSVSVKSTVDVSLVTKTSTIYEEPDWAADGSTNGQGIIGSRVWSNAITRGDGSTVGGVVGNSSNAELNEYGVDPGQANGDERTLASSGQIDFDVTQHNIVSETPGGTVTDVMVSIVINSAAVQVPNTDALVRSVARASGIGSEIEGEKIAILAYPFYDSPDGEENPIEQIIEGFVLPRWALFALIAGVALFLVLLILILVLRGRANKRKLREKEEEAAAALLTAQELQRSLAAQGEAVNLEAQQQGADIMDMNTERSMELRRDVRQFAEENPGIAAQMVKNWLRGGDSNG